MASTLFQEASSWLSCSKKKEIRLFDVIAATFAASFCDEKTTFDPSKAKLHIALDTGALS